MSVVYNVMANLILRFGNVRNSLLFIILGLCPTSIGLASHILPGVPIAFPENLGPVVYRENVNPQISATVYALKGGIDVSWWRKELELSFIFYVDTMPIHSLSHMDNYPGLVAAYRAAVLFGREGYDNHDKDMHDYSSAGFFRKSTMDLKGVEKEIQKESLFKKDQIQTVWGVIYDAIMDYQYYQPWRSVVGETSSRNLVTLHAPGYPSHVFMTMRVDISEDGTIAEHRHISRAVSSVIAPYIDKEMPKSPRDIAMITHAVAARAARKITNGKAKYVSVEPLPTMRAILAKHELISGRDVREFTRVKVEHEKLIGKYISKLNLKNLLDLLGVSETDAGAIKVHLSTLPEGDRVEIMKVINAKGDM